MSVSNANTLPVEFQIQLEQALLPTHKTVELQSAPFDDYLHRLRSRAPHVAELFLENSKIARSSRHNAALDSVGFERTRDWFFTTAYQPRVGDFDDELAAQHGARLRIEQLPPPLAALLGALVSTEAIARLLYAVDLFLLAGLRSYRLIPFSEWLWLDRTLRAEEADRLARALLGVPPEAVQRADALLAVVVVPTRYTLFQGPRGYRRTLVELGSFLERCAERADDAAVGLTTMLDFHDFDVDAVLRLDGVERTTHAVCLLDTRRAGT